ncbi:MAG: hypothetical protein ISR51_07365 [Rhodospirillales bacterium]|nr:hypothetical protein [Alphaproteobacteria bacterium]MBL6948480.1 hypothetical protein [Rhodospirillales bacterium]
MIPGGKHLLVVEDDEAAAEFMEIVLANLGHRVTAVLTVENGLVGFPGAAAADMTWW